MTTDTHWRQAALCAQTDPELWFPHDRTAVKAKDALAVCATCPVLAECRDWTDATKPEYGISGGTTEWQRAQAARDERARVAAELGVAA